MPSFRVMNEYVFHTHIATQHIIPLALSLYLTIVKARSYYAWELEASGTGRNKAQTEPISLQFVFAMLVVTTKGSG